MYILVLSLAPCGDSVECGESNKTEKSHNKHKHENENCTPFCICACCGQPVTSKINYPVAQAILKPVFFIKSIAIYNKRLSRNLVPASGSHLKFLSRLFVALLCNAFYAYCFIQCGIIHD